MPTFDYSVDGEDQTTSEHELKAGEILKSAGLDPTQRYLIELVGAEQKKYTDPNAIVHMHEHQKFVSAFIGPVPVS